VRALQQNWLRHTQVRNKHSRLSPSAKQVAGGRSKKERKQLTLLPAKLLHVKSHQLRFVCHHRLQREAAGSQVARW